MMARSVPPLSAALHFGLAALFIIFAPKSSILPYFVMLAALIWAMSVDIERFEIPDRAVILVAFSGVTSGWINHFEMMLLDAIASIALGLALWAFGAWYFRRYGREGLGLGDAKLLAALGLWSGAENVFMLVFCAAFLGVLSELIMRVKLRKSWDSRDPIPFGVAIGYAGNMLAVYRYCFEGYYYV